jgi:type I restriction enzyme M protein
MTADGFSLDHKRNEVSENDIPYVVARFHNLEGEADRTRKEQSFLVPVEEIREKGYDLSMNKYKEVEREVVTYDAPEVIMERIVNLETQINDALNEFRAKFM